ncbi:MAG: metallopeptidase TldD-related protein [Ignavibacteriales bacterium]|nr:metallopeptidase TldD-related protein [Ignavibacteriales bacterium]
MRGRGRRSISSTRPSPDSTPRPRSDRRRETERAALARQAHHELLRGDLRLERDPLGPGPVERLRRRVRADLLRAGRRTAGRRHRHTGSKTPGRRRSAASRTWRRRRRSRRRPSSGPSGSSKPRKIRTQNVPGHLRADPDGLADGLPVRLCRPGPRSIRRRRSSRAKLGQRIGGERDHRRRRRPASRASSAPTPSIPTAIPSRRTVVVERGVLKSYLCNHYAARKLGAPVDGKRRRRRRRPGQLLPRAGRRRDAARDIVAGTKKGPHPHPDARPRAELR